MTRTTRPRWRRLAPWIAAPVAGMIAFGAFAWSGRTAQATDDVEQVTLLAAGSPWRYRYDAAAAAPGWTTTSFDDSTWKSGPAPLGFGDKDIATVITTGSDRPLTAYARTTFTVPTGHSYDDIEVSVRSDDGAAVYVNGTEVGRSNLPTGALTAGTYALDSIKRQATFAVPADLLVPGVNVVAVESHLNYRATRAVGIEASITAVETDNGIDVPGWGTPVFADEFDGAAVDTGKWRINRNSSYTYVDYDQSARYPDQVTQDDGILTISADRRDTPITFGDGKPRYFDSGTLDTIGIFSQQYGRFEIRARLPLDPGTSRGMWPSFWLRDSRGTGEIDIFEALGTPHDQERVQPLGASAITVHQDTRHTGADVQTKVKSVDLADGQYHTHTLEWTPEAMTFFIDGVQVWQVLAKDTSWFTTSFTSAGVNLRLDLAVGSPWSGNIDLAKPETTADGDFDVDYVRVWAYQG